MDLKITGGQIEIVDGEPVLVTKAQAVAQDLEYTLRMIRGESRYDLNMGAPWLELFEDRDARDDEIAMVCESVSLTVPNVTVAQVVQISRSDTSGRETAFVTMNATALDQEFDFVTELPL